MAISNDLKHELTKDFHTFREACEKFYNKEMSVGDFKGISGNFGSYAEKRRRNRHASLTSSRRSHSTVSI